MAGGRRLTLVFIFLMMISVVGGWAEEDRAPVVLVMPGTVGEGAAAGDLESVAAVSTYLSAIGKVTVVAFDLENPTIARYILERKFGDDWLNKISDPKTAKEIADLLKADYILSVHGELRPNAALIALRLIPTSGKGEWTAGAESGIAQNDGPQGVISRRNAINTAASAAVSEIDIAAFDKLKPKSGFVVTEPPSTLTPAAPAVPVEQPTTRDLTAEFTAHMNAADAYAKRDDQRNVIYELRQAVNIEPKTASVRLKLAEAYSAAGMPEDAADELKRALLFRPDEPAIYDALGQLYLANGALREAADQFREVVRLDPTSVQARVSVGNILWNQNKLDEAAAVFEEAAKIDPANTLPHERLFKLYWARRNYALAIEHLIAGKPGGAEMDPVARYKLSAGLIDTQLTEILAKLDSSWAEYQDKQLTREDYYRDCTDMVARIDGLASFMSTQTAPESLKSAHSHAVLCVNLLSQSAGSLVLYLETDKQDYSEQASLFREEAKSELEEFRKGIGS